MFSLPKKNPQTKQVKNGCFEFCYCFGVSLCYRKKIPNGTREGILLIPTLRSAWFLALGLGLLASITSLVVSPRFKDKTKAPHLPLHLGLLVWCLP